MKETPTGLDIELIEKVATKLNSLTHPDRVAIIELLLEKEKLCVGDIHKQIKIEQASCSHHLKILKQSGILASKREGKKIIYSVKAKALKVITDTVTKCNNA